MKKEGNILSHLVLILTIISLLSASFSFKETGVKEKYKSEKQEQKQKAPELKAYSPQNLTHFAHFDFNTSEFTRTSFLAILPEKVIYNDPQYVSRYFRTLLLFVISPNAP